MTGSIDICAGPVRGMLSVIDSRPEAEYGYMAGTKEVFDLLRQRGFKVGGIAVMTAGVRTMRGKNPKRRTK